MAATGTSPSVPLFDLRVEDADLAAVEAVLRSGRLKAGEEAAGFESDFAAKLGCEHAVLLASCTAALHLAYLTAGVGPGDEVIVPSYTFAATAASVYACGATPVFADVLGPHDLALDPADVAARITPRTKAVSVVHFAGYPAAVDALRALCAERGIVLLEDAAHAPLTPPHGLSAAYSFFSNKVLSAGEGGLLATDDDAAAALARRLRDPEGGLANYRMDDWRAALLLSRMERMAGDIARRRELTHRYRRLLAGEDRCVVPYRDHEVGTSSCYVMPVVLADGERRAEIRTRLREDHGVQTSVLYPATHEFTAYRDRPGTSPLPRSERIARAEVTLPLFATLDDATLDRVAAAFLEVL